MAHGDQKGRDIILMATNKGRSLYVVPRKYYLMRHNEKKIAHVSLDGGLDRSSSMPRTLHLISFQQYFIATADNTLRRSFSFDAIFHFSDGYCR
jgi:hypothetical protein